MLHVVGKKLFYVVVGTGRCGTVFFARLLSAVGVPCGHERIFDHRGLDHAIRAMKNGGPDSNVSRRSGLAYVHHVMAEASYMAVPYLEHGMLRDATIIHAVRNPVDVILSFNNKLQYFQHGNRNKWERFIESHLPGIDQYDSALMKNCYYVLRWNQMIERFADGRKYLRVRVEHDADALLHFLNVPRQRWPNIGVVNSHEHWVDRLPPLANPATREHILSSPLGDQIKALGESYGYNIKPFWEG